MSIMVFLKSDHHPGDYDAAVACGEVGLSAFRGDLSGFRSSVKITPNPVLGFDKEVVIFLNHSGNVHLVGFSNEVCK